MPIWTMSNTERVDDSNSEFDDNTQLNFLQKMIREGKRNVRRDCSRDYNFLTLSQNKLRHCDSTSAIFSPVSNSRFTMVSYFQS